MSGVRRGCVPAFGISDPDLGTEKLVVVAETREETEEERQRIAHQIQTRLADVFEAPADDVLLVPPRALPKTSSGKLRRSDCRALYLKEELGGVKKPRAMLLKIAGAEAAVALRRNLAVAGRWAYGLYALATAALDLLPLWLMALIVPSRRAMSAAARLAVRVWLVASGCRLRVRGIEHLVKTAGPLVFVANDASYLDPLLVIAALPRDCAFVVKREAMGWPVLGAIIRRLEHVPVERFDPKESAASAESLRQVWERQRSLFFFPEGTFSLTAGLLPFRLGAFKLAAETGRPIVPVALVGTRRWLSNGVLLRRTDLELVVEAPLVAPTTALSDLVRLREESAERIARLVGEPRLDQVTAGPLAAER